MAAAVHGPLTITKLSTPNSHYLRKYHLQNTFQKISTYFFKALITCQLNLEPQTSYFRNLIEEQNTVILCRMGAWSELTSWSQIGPFSVTEARFLRQRTEPGKGGSLFPAFMGPETPF